MTPQNAFQLWVFDYMSYALVISLIANVYLGLRLWRPRDQKTVPSAH